MTTNFVLYYIDAKTNKRYAETLFVNQSENLKSEKHLRRFKKADVVAAFATKKDAIRTAKTWNEKDKSESRLMTADEYTAFVYGK